MPPTPAEALRRMACSVPVRSPRNPCGQDGTWSGRRTGAGRTRRPQRRRGVL